jgi:hypothetical protein
MSQRRLSWFNDLEPADNGLVNAGKSCSAQLTITL